MPHPCSRLRLRLAPWRTASSSDFAIAEPFWRINWISLMAIFQASSGKLVAGHQRADGRADEARGRRGGEVRDRRADCPVAAQPIVPSAASDAASPMPSRSMCPRCYRCQLARCNERHLPWEARTCSCCYSLDVDDVPPSVVTVTLTVPALSAGLVAVS